MFACACQSRLTAPGTQQKRDGKMRRKDTNAIGAEKEESRERERGSE